MFIFMYLKQIKELFFKPKISENFSYWLTNSLNFKSSASANSKGETRKETLFTFSPTDTLI